jgi:hypothetical protein
MKSLRIEKYIHNKETTDNLIKLYKHLKGKENLNKRLFLKTLVWCSLFPKEIDGDEEWISPEREFHPNNYYSSTMERLNGIYMAHLYLKEGCNCYNHNTKKVFGKLI